MTKLLLILFTALCQIVVAQTTDFSFQSSGNNCLPVDVQFTQTSTGSPVGYLWDFGNGSRSNTANPVATYSTAGSYTVRLITVYANNTAQSTHTVVIHPAISASFTTNRSNMCQPGTVNFTATTSGELGNLEWDFGDGSSHVTGTEHHVAHNFTGFGEFTITLTATSQSGCVVSSNSIVKITSPLIAGSINSPALGCIPATVQLAASVTVATGSSVSSYTWNFGDGTTSTTTLPHASHNYNQVGSYSPQLSIVTTEGCTATYRFDSVAYGRPPTNQSAHSSDSAYCGSDIAQFYSTAVNANRYDWSFAGSGIISVTDTMIEHKFTSLGRKAISVTPLFNGCPGTAVDFDVDIIGVIARYKYNNTCSDKNNFLFDNQSQGHISTINWDLGNGVHSVNPDTVSHSYPDTGTFNIKLLITDDITGCVDSFKTKIYTAKPIMQNPDLSICINTQSQFSLLNNYSNPSMTYLWNVLGTEIGPGSDSSPVVTSTELGHFNSQVILNNGTQYCPDTIRLPHSITVRGPQLDFTAPNEICLNTPLSVVNLSHAYQPEDTIKVWYWNFGRTAGNDSTFQPQPYAYGSAGTYNVKLTGIDKTGCMDSLVKRLFVRPMPFLWIIPKLDTICEGQQSTLIGYTSDNIQWTPASTGFCTNCDTTIVRPLQTTKYYASSTNAYNCMVTDSALIKVYNPFTAHMLASDTSVCQGASIKLDVDPKEKVVTWSPAATVSDAHSYTPDISPVQSATYVATLTDSAGCFSSNASVNINVKSKPVVDAGPDKIYPYNTTYSLSPVYSNNVRSWLWSPADSLSCSTCPSPIGNSATTKTYTIKVLSDSGCTASDNITVFVECNGANLLMPAAFTPNNDNLNDYYYPITRGIKTIKRFAIYNRGGQLVYERRNFTPNKDKLGWDGKYRGQDQDPAAYMYFLEAVCDLDQALFTKGSFILVR